MGRYQEAISDTELLALRDDIALLDTRLGDVLAGLTTGESGTAWSQVASVQRDMQMALDEDDAETLAALVRSLGWSVTQAAHDMAIWRDAFDLIEQRRKLVESEQKRLTAMEQMLTAEQAVTVAGALIEAVRRHVSDRDILAAVQRDFTRLLGRADRDRPEPATTRD